MVSVSILFYYVLCKEFCFSMEINTSYLLFCCSGFSSKWQVASSISRCMLLTVASVEESNTQHWAFVAPRFLSSQVFNINPLKLHARLTSLTIVLIRLQAQCRCFKGSWSQNASSCEERLMPSLSHTRPFSSYCPRITWNYCIPNESTVNANISSTCLWKRSPSW